MRKLAELLEAIPRYRADGTVDREVASISLDSSATSADDLFIRLLFDPEGIPNDPEEAARRGAAAILAEYPRPSGFDSRVTWIEVPDTLSVMGLLYARHHAEPSDSLEVLAVTGTNGKSTVTWILRHILRATGRVAGLLGTVEYSVGERTLPSKETTPPPHLMQPLLADMRAAGCTHVALEACAQSIVLGHLQGVRVAVAGMTNLTRETLDFFGSMDAYRDAKSTLFSKAESACFNVDDPTGAEFAQAFARRKVTVSQLGADATFRAFDAKHTLEGFSARLATPQGEYELRADLVGQHNVENVLVALGMAHLAGIDLDAAVAAMATVSAPPGRFERLPGPRRIYIDYAHTPDGLEKMLSAVRPHCAGRLLCVFSACGGRDRGKRPEMGAAVGRFADTLVITSDSPRFEAPGAILRDLLDGVPREAHVIVEPDRAQAIDRAVRLMAPEDVLILAGKGHERRIEIRGEFYPFHERDIVAAAVRDLDGPIGARGQ